MTRGRRLAMGAAAALALLAPGAPTAAQSVPQQEAPPAPEPPARPGELFPQELADAWVYLLGRALVAQREAADLRRPAGGYNVLEVHQPGATDVADPDLGMATLEAWLAVDVGTAALLEVPPIGGRYYTVQVCDEWGEVIANINERTFPHHPHGQFAFVAPGSLARLPESAARITLHSRKAKLLVRIAVGGDLAGAVALQRRFSLTAHEGTAIAQPVELPSFDEERLPGVELFDAAGPLMTSALDVAPLAAEQQARVRAVAARLADAEERARADRLLREEIGPRFRAYAQSEAGASRDAWFRLESPGSYGRDFWRRAAAQLVQPWANRDEEVVRFVATHDAEGQPLLGSAAYALHFASDQRPDSRVGARWSLTLLGPTDRVAPNPRGRFERSGGSGLESDEDGSLRILVAPEPRPGYADLNWLPAPSERPFRLVLRMVVPRDPVRRGEWFPPAPVRLPAATAAGGSRPSSAPTPPAVQ